MGAVDGLRNDARHERAAADPRPPRCAHCCRGVAERDGGVAMPVGAIIGGSAIMAGGTVASSLASRSAASNASKQQQTAINAQIAWEKEQDAKNREEYAKSEEERKRQWEAEQQQAAEDRAENLRRYQQDYGESRRRYDQDFGESRRISDRNFGEDVRRYEAKETRLQPFRREGTAAVGQLGQLAAQAMQAGIHLRPALNSTAGLPGGPGTPPYAVATPRPPAPPPGVIVQGGTMAGLVPGQAPSITVPPPFRV